MVRRKFKSKRYKIKRNYSNIYPSNQKIPDLINLVKNGNLVQAKKLAKTLYRHNSNSPQLLNIIGALDFRLGNNERAIEFYKKALSLMPKNFEALYNLSVSLNFARQHKEAKNILIKILKDNPNSYLAFQELGNSYKNLHQPHEAIQNFQKSLSIKPNQISTLNHLGILYSQLGKNTDALNCFRKVLNIQPNWLITHRHISLVTDYRNNKSHIAELEALFTKDLTPQDEIQIRYAYFKAMSDLGNIDEAFKNLSRSKKLRKFLSKTDPKTDLKIFKTIKDFFINSQRNKEKNNLDHNKFKNIFIVGMPRSGTTLIEQILAAHSSVFGSGEVPFFGNKLYPIFMAESESRSHWKKISSYNSMKKEYTRYLAQLEPNKPYIVDKMPTNFLWLGFILETFPTAKIINVERDPMALIWSNFKHYFLGREFNFTNDLDDTLNYYLEYKNLMSFWKGHFKDKIYNLSYERLTEEPKLEVLKMLKFCGLNWEDECLHYYKNLNFVATASRNQVRQAIYRNSSLEWKKYGKYLEPTFIKLKSLQNQSSD